MSLKLVFLFCFVSNLAIGSVFSQASRLNLKFEKQSIPSVLEKLKNMTDYEFFYQKGSISDVPKISGDFSEATVEQILDVVLKQQGYLYELEGNVILVRKAEEKATSQGQQETFTIKGKVMDAQKETLIGATVVIEGTTLGVATNVDGEFTLQVPNRTGKLVISCIGYKTLTVAYEAGKPLDVVLEEDVQEMDEVVVTGIFNRPRESFTGSVRTVTNKDLKLFRSQNLLTTLRNIDPSINIATDNLAGSDPNRELEVTIRGNSSLPTDLEELETTAGKQLNAPLVIVDGFEVSLQKLKDFNDEEIESINILKDASSTAIYGSRGANGVIVIKTKDPQAGKLKVFLSAGLNLEIPDLSSYDLLDAKEKLALERMVGLYDADTPYEDMRLKGIYNQRVEDAMRGETEWIREPVRIGTGSRVNLRLEGGSQEFRWAISLGNNLVKGAMKGSERNTTSASITLTYNVKNLKFRNLSALNYYKADHGMYGNFSKYAEMNPYFRAKDEQGNLIESYELTDGSLLGNPLCDAYLGGKNEQKETTLQNIFSIDWQINNSLSLRGQLGLAKSFSSADHYVPAEHSSFINTPDYFSKGSYNYTTGENFSIDGNLTLNYATTFGDRHTVSGGLYASIAKTKDFNYQFQTQGLLNPNFNDLSNALSYKTGTVPTGMDETTASVGFTGYVNYTYDNRYYVDGSFRMDGSSRFGSSRRFAPFWSVGIGWNIHRESFFIENNIVNTLRLRLSVGESGSQQFAPYQALSTYNFTSGSRYLYWTSASLMGLANEDLTWQTTMQYNAGLDIELLSNRLSAGLDVFYKKTDDLLSAMDVKLAHGFSSYTENIGAVENYGYEAMLGGYIVRDYDRELVWNVTGRLTYTKNKIVKLSEDLKRQVEEKSKTSEYGALLFEGDSQNSIYAVRSLGIDPIDGEEMFLDNDGKVTKTWDPSYRVFCGVGEPTYRGMLSSYLSWKDFSLNLSFAYHWGGVQYNNTLIDKVETKIENMWNNVDQRVFSDRWQNPGEVKFFKGYSNEDTRSSSRFVMDDKVFQLQSVNLQYRWDTPFVRKYLGAETVNVSMNMSDLFYFSTIKRERGLNYPFANNIQIGLSVIF